MKKALLFLCAALVLAACNPPATTTTTDGDTTKVDSPAVAVTDPVATDSPAVPADTSADPVADPNGTPTTGRQADPNVDLGGKTFTVSGNFLVISPYCGGAAPTPDMVEAAKTPQPLANQGFLIRKGSMNAPGTALVTRVRTNAQGTFSVALKPGTYCMVLDEKENRRTPEFLNTQYYEIDKKCDDKWLNGCELSFTVADKNISGLRLTLTRKCHINSFSPCINWGGPLPSSPSPRGGK
jgi:hypothetical protein